MHENCGLTVTPSNKAMLAGILKEYLVARKSFFERLLCWVRIHNKRNYEKISFCASCFKLLDGAESDLRSALDAAKFQLEKSTILAANSHAGTFAYEDNCNSIRVEDILTVEMLCLVLKKLKEKK